MWNVLSKTQVFSFAALVLGFVFLLLLFVVYGDGSSLTINESNVLKTFRLLSHASVITMVLLYVIAKWGWKLLWHFPLSWVQKHCNEKICPELNGQWQVDGISSFGTGEAESTPWSAKAMIEMSLMDFQMKQLSNKTDQKSKVVVSQIDKDHQGRFHLTYVFESATDELETGNLDELPFAGAAKLRVIFDDEGEISMKGEYWTNRERATKKATSGSLKLTRLTVAG